jgi:putative Ca2+/H+ antiporter (TMEM165/GDT1 family)
VIEALFLSLGVIFLAELGDKSQLMALAFAARYPAFLVLLAVTLATLAVHAGSVALGTVTAAALPTTAINIMAGFAFVGFAWWTLRGDHLGADDCARAAGDGRWAVLTIGTAFFLAELGDKTMLATVTLASTEEPIGTWLGSTAGMVLADAIAVGVGNLMGTRLPAHGVKPFSAIAFVAFGAALIAEGLGIP